MRRYAVLRRFGLVVAAGFLLGAVLGWRRGRDPGAAGDRWPGIDAVDRRWRRDPGGRRC